MSIWNLLEHKLPEELVCIIAKMVHTNNLHKIHKELGSSPETNDICVWCGVQVINWTWDEKWYIWITRYLKKHI